MKKISDNFFDSIEQCAGLDYPRRGNVRPNEIIGVYMKAGIQKKKLLSKLDLGCGVGVSRGGGKVEVWWMIE